MSSLNPHRARLAARLRGLRTGTGLSGNRFAAQLGWHQSRVSKLETGAQLPTEDDLRTWVAATSQSPQTEAELIGMLAATRFGYSSNRDMVHDGLAAAQAYIAALESETTWIAEFQPACIPGLVQTAAYARELLVLHGGPVTAGASEAEVEALVAERIRRQEILYHPGKRIQIVLGETALHDSPGSVETLVGQLDRLVTVAGLATVDLAVLPIGTPMPILPLGSFVVHDGRCVFVETMTGEQRIEDPDQVAVYATAFDLLREAAATGPDAGALIRRVMHDLEAGRTW